MQARAYSPVSFFPAATVLALGDANGNAKSNITIDQLTINDGGVVRLQGQGTNAENTNIKLAGGSLYLHDSNNKADTYHFGQVNVAKNSKMEIAWKGTMLFESLTGDANLAISNLCSDNRTVEFKNIVNYNGTVTSTMNGNSTLKIGHVSQDVTKNATITSTLAVTSADFQKSGLGSLSMNNLTVNGTLYMTYEGGLSIGTAGTFDGLHVGNNSTLKYDNAPNLITLGSGSLTGVTGLTVNIDKATGKSLVNGGYNLGIAEGYTGTISVSGMTADTDYTLAAKDGYWHLTLAKADALIWDTNWGAAEIMTAPAVTEAAKSDAESILSGAATKLTGTGGNDVVVIGAVKNNSYTGDTWIYAQEGKYKALIGANYADNWNSGTRADFNGDTHILVDGATVGTIIGGNYKDGKGPQRTGDTYISIMDGSTVERSIIGVDLLTHNASPQQTGNVNIFIYTSLGTVTNDITAMHGESADMVIGGFAWGTNHSGTPTLTGDTNITVDLTNATNKGTAFGKHLIGGNANGSSYGTHVLTGNTHVNVNLAGGSMGNGMKVIGGSWTQGNTSTHNGDTNVTIDGDGTYNGQVVAGSWLLSGTANIHGNTNMTIKNGTFAQNVVGGTALSNGTSTHDNGGTNVTITGGTFNSMVIAGNDVTGGTANLRGDTHLTITGGTFSGQVLGGSRTTGNFTANVTGTTNIDISGGTFGNDAWVIGGSYHETNGVTQTVGGVEMNLTGGTFNGLVIGGNRINGNGNTAFTKSEMGDIHITVNGATINKKLYGGGYTVRNVASNTLVQGNITLDLLSGHLAEDVYAAGYQGGQTKLSTQSVTVNVGKDITFGNNKAINARYDKGSGVTMTSTYGTATLNFVDNDTYANTTTLTVWDFDTITHKHDLTLKQIVGAGHLTKTGAANLTSTNGLDYVNQLTVESGTLTLGAEGAISNVSSNTFTKDGAGTLVINKTSSAMTNGKMIINGGVVELAASGDATAVLSGTTVEVNAGGTLKLKHDSLGWGSTSTSLIKLTGTSATDRATLTNTDTGSNTLRTSISMNGFTTVNSNNSEGNFSTMSGSGITATGTDNVFADTLSLREDFTITVNNTTVDEVTTTGELEISGKMIDYSSTTTAAITKSGAGTLILSNSASTYSGSITVNAGKLKLNGDNANPGTASLTFAENTELETAGTMTLANVISGSGDLTVSSGTLTLNNATVSTLHDIDVAAEAGLTLNEGKALTISHVLTNEGSLTLNGATTVSNTIINDGTITFGANATLSIADVTTLDPAGSGEVGYRDTVSHDTKNGFVNASFVLIKTSDGTETNVTGITDSLISGYTLEKEGNDYVLNSTGSGGDYYINEGTVSYEIGSTANKIANEGTTGIVLNGTTAKLNMVTDLRENVGVSVNADSTIAIGAGATLNKSSVTLNNGSTLTLEGTGTYVISDKENTALGATLSQDWDGWVRLDNLGKDAVQMGLNGYGPNVEVVGLFHNTTGYLNNEAITANVKLTDTVDGTDTIYAVSLRNGNNNDTYTFEGKVSGDGHIVHSLQGGSTKNIVFKNDVSEWTGGFDSSYDNSNETFTTNVKFQDDADRINASVTASGDAVVHLTIDNANKVVYGETEDSEGNAREVAAEIAINKNGGTLTTSGAGAKEFNDSVAAAKLVTTGGENTFAQGATFGTTTLANQNDNTPGTLKAVTIDSTHLTGATSGTGADIKALGEMTSMTLAAAADMDVSNVTMYDSTINAANHAITYSTADGSRVMAVATSVKPATRSNGPALSRALEGDNNRTLTEIGTVVQDGGTATGTLTVDIAYPLLNAHRGEDLQWTLLSGVDISDLALNFGDVLTTIVNNGKPVVTLKVGDDTQTIDASKLAANNGDYNLLDGYTGSATVILTVHNVPEPATGTLSVLALAALAARRRRSRN